jgi:hypothetical protein
MSVNDRTEGIMATGELPITRSDLREELNSILQHYATKKDVAELETRLIKWMVGQMIAAIVAASSIALLIQRLID